ncbi:hypothetical protein Tco_0391797 [Tanacetum coccineum]
MFDEFFNPASVCSLVLEVAAAPRPVLQTGSPSSTSNDKDAPFTSLLLLIKNTAIIIQVTTAAADYMD